MTILQAIVLGLVQGISEFLPISSSGHLILIPELFGWEHQGIDFDVAIHLATLCSVLWVLRKDIVQILKGRFLWKIVVATIPIVLAGFLLSGAVLDSLRNTTVVGVMLILWGVILWGADYVATKNGVHKQAEKLGFKQALLIGTFQVFALVPGTSRSGSTISAGLFMGLSRKEAARFSFLLSIPAIGGAGILVFSDAIQNGFETPLLPMICGFFSAFLAGSLAITFLLKLVERISYGWFAGYRVLLGVILIIFF